MDTFGNARRLGTWLLAFGLVGVVLAGIIAIGLVGGAIAARNLDDSLAADQARLVSTLNGLTGTVDKLAVTTANAGDTLGATQTAVSHASDVLGQVAAISDDLGTSLDISILGARPLAGPAAKFAGLGDQVRVIATDLDTIGTKLATNASDLSGMADEVRQVEARITDLSTRIASFDRTGEVVSLIVGGIFLGGLLVAWLAVAAGFCAWMGWRIRKAAEPASAATIPAAPSSPTQPSGPTPPNA